MAFIKNGKELKDINILASDNKVVLTYQSATGMEVSEDGRKIIKKGTVYPKNDATAIGITWSQDYDVTDGDVPISVLVEGHVIAERLPVEPSAEAVAALRQIEFHKEL